MAFDAVGIITGNMAEALRFYALLGLRFEAVGGAEHQEATTPSGVRLMLDDRALVERLQPGWRGGDDCASGNGGVVLCFRQEDPARVDALYGEMTGAGFAGVTAPWDAFWGQRYASVLDPDGNQVDLFAPLSA